MEKPLLLSLEELFVGTKKKMRISRRLSDEPGDERRQERILEMDLKPGLKAGSKIMFFGVGDLENGRYQDVVFIVTEVGALSLHQERLNPSRQSDTI